MANIFKIQTKVKINCKLYEVIVPKKKKKKKLGEISSRIPE